MTNGRKREKTKKVEDMTRRHKRSNEDTRLKHSFWDNLDRSTNHDPGADPGFFLGGGAPSRNGVTDW